MSNKEIVKYKKKKDLTKKQTGALKKNGIKRSNKNELKKTKTISRQKCIHMDPQSSNDNEQHRGGCLSTRGGGWRDGPVGLGPLRYCT